MTAIVPVGSSEADHAAFDTKARSLGFDPSDPWVGGYVDYEWAHLRHMIDALPLAISGAKVLEVGCNVGASSIVMSRLGAQVTAFDISSDFVELARLNARQYDCRKIRFDHVRDSRQLPYANDQFDLVLCNSVLEYIPAADLQSVAAELHRVLHVGGLVLLTGTSNRIWPRELHSRRWGANYVPRIIDSLVKVPIQRGLTPWHVKSCFGKPFQLLERQAASDFYARSRLAMGMSEHKVRLLLRAARLLHTEPGFLTPSMSCLLRRIS